MQYGLAIDIGASSGRHIVGWRERGELVTREVYRFPNGVRREEGRLVWDTEALLREVCAGIDAALRQFPQLDSLAIDTWGVDYVLLRRGEPVLPVYAYRDSRTEPWIPKLHRLVPPAELYARTGCQYQPFNTIYQLYTDLRTGRLDGVTEWMMLPEYLTYRLCGAAAHEYTNATTTGLVSAATGEYDGALLDRLGLPRSLFPKLVRPGATVGTYRGIRCVLCATHDTASAVEGIPMAEPAPYISSGTWSLLGIKTAQAHTDAHSRAANFTNEGGVGYFRYQKNIMGLWLVNELRRELAPQQELPALLDAARESRCEALIDPNAAVFLAPESMREAFDRETGGVLRSTADYLRCACRSLARSYREALAELETGTNTHSDCLYIIGGGAGNTFLNDLTAQETGKRVIALPIEATALGNLKIQLEAEL